MEPLSKRSRVPLVTVPAEEVISFHLLKKDAATGQAVLEEGSQFPPEMTHQLFGDKEVIEGYDGLAIDIWLTPLFQAFIEVSAASKAEHGATDLRTPFAEAFTGAGFLEDKAAFDAALQQEPPLETSILGKQLVEEVQEQPPQQGGGAAGATRTLRVYHAPIASADPALKVLHERLQPLLYFFVDGASMLLQTDDNWRLLTVVEETTGSGGAREARILGFATVYRHFRYPAGCRLKLSQILVFPPYQGRGAGSLLLQATNRLAEETDAFDLAYEEPAEQLQALRTGLDVRRALELEWVRPAVQQRLAALAGDGGKGKGKEPASAASAATTSARSAAVAAEAARTHPLAAPPAVLEQLRRELRLSKLQAAAVWRVLLYVVGDAEEAVVEGIRGLLQQGIVTQQAAAKEDAQGKSVRETDSGFIMCRGASSASRLVPLLPVEEQSAEQQADAVVEAADAQLETVVAVGSKFILEEEEDEDGGEDDDSEE